MPVKKAGQRAGVVAGPVAQGFRIMLGQSGQDEQIVLERRERLQASRGVRSSRPVSLGIQSGRCTPLGT